MKRKVLFLAPYPFGLSPSQRFRFEHFIKKDYQEQLTFHFKSFWSKAAWRVLYEPGHFVLKSFYLCTSFVRRCFHCVQAIGYDYIFIHRELTPVGPPIFELILTKVFRKKVIYDFDDAIWIQNTSAENHWAKWVKFHSKTSHICKWAYKISVGNEYLADFALKFNDNVVILPTVVDTMNVHDKIKNHQHNQPLVIGWTGTHSTNKYLKIVEPVLEKLMLKHDFSLLVISNKKPNLDIPYQFKYWNKEEEINQLMQMDIGLMPISTEDWEKGKCGFKLIQYLALGIPALSTNFGVNKHIITHGETGFLCADEQDWLKYLELMITEPAQLDEMGKRGREKIEMSYSVKSIEGRFLMLFA